MPAVDGAGALLLVERRDGAELDRAVLDDVLPRPLQRLADVVRVHEHRLLAVADALLLPDDRRHFVPVRGVVAAANVEERHDLINSLRARNYR